MSRKYSVPCPLKAKLLAWTELNINEVDMLINLFHNGSNNNEIYSFLEKNFDLNSSSRPKDKILIDLHYYALKFAFANNFSKIQISSFVSILRALHRANQETPFDNYDHLLRYFQDLVICHSIKRPPFCVAIFDHQNVVKLISFISDTYLKHYKLYKYAFTPLTGINLKFNYVGRDSRDNENKLNSQSIVADFSDKSLNTISGTSIKTVMPESQVKTEMRKYIRQLLNDELENQQIKEKLIIEF